MGMSLTERHELLREMRERLILLAQEGGDEDA